MPHHSWFCILSFYLCCYFSSLGRHLDSFVLKKLSTTYLSTDLSILFLTWYYECGLYFKSSRCVVCVVHVCLFMCVWRPEVNLRWCSSGAKPCVLFETESLAGTLCLLIRIGWLTSKLQGSAGLHLTSTGIKSTSHHSRLLLWYWCWTRVPVLAWQTRSSRAIFLASTVPWFLSFQGAVGICKSKWWYCSGNC